MARTGCASSAMATVALVLVVAMLVVMKTDAELTTVEHTPKTQGSLNILAVGDWGRRGQFNQTLVAAQVGTHCKRLSRAAHT
jgi:tartrate-resistant acid phosphatase type 5